MKNFIILPLVVLTIMLIVPTTSKAATLIPPITIDTSYTTESTQTNALIIRLNEISSMDMSTLSASEKKELRSEVRSIKNEMKDNGGIYLSVGALLLVIILLIILL